MANNVIAQQLSAAVGSHRGTEAADLLCEACVELLGVSAVAISLIFDGANTGTLGASGLQARRYDEVQFTLGEGPCLDAVARRGPVHVPDLTEIALDNRWPAYVPAMLAYEIHGVFAMPVLVAGEYVGALDLFCRAPGPLTVGAAEGALVAAELAELPLLDLIAVQDLQSSAIDAAGGPWAELNALSRIEVSQATGMVMAQLDVDATEALVRLRAHAYRVGRSATDVARDILARRLRLESDG